MREEPEHKEHEACEVRERVMQEAHEVREALEHIGHETHEALELARQEARRVHSLADSLKTKGFIAEEELEYFTYEYKKACNLGELYLLLNIHERHSVIPGRQFLSKCEIFTETLSEFSENELKSIVQKGKSYNKPSVYFLKKI